MTPRNHPSALLATLITSTLLGLAAIPGQEADPGLDASTLAQIEALRLEGKFDAALELIDAQASLEAREKRTLALRGLLLYDLGETDRGAAVASILSKTYQEDVYALILIARSKIGIGSTQSAVQTLKIAKLYAADNAEVQFLSLLASAIADPTHETGASLLNFSRRNELPSGLFTLYAIPTALTIAKDLVQNDSHPDSVHQFLDAAEMVEDYQDEALLLRAELLIRTDRPDDAIPVLQSISDKHPHLMDRVLFLRAMQANKQGDVETARGMINDSLTLNRENADVLLLGSHIAIESENREDLARYLSILDAIHRTQEVDDLYSQYYLIRADEADEEGRKGDTVVFLRQAEDRCIRICKIDPFNIEILQRVIEISERLGSRSRIDPDKARNDLSLAMKVHKKS